MGNSYDAVQEEDYDQIIRLKTRDTRRKTQGRIEGGREEAESGRIRIGERERK
jgi:hypothetical protein